MASPKTTASLIDDHGTWTVRGRVFDLETGKTRQRSKSTGLKVRDNTKRKAEALMGQIVDEWEQEREKISRSSSPTFDTYVWKFIERKRRLRKKENTIKSYLDYARKHIFPKLGSIPIQTMTLRDIEDFYAEYLETHTVNSARKVNCVINGAFREAIRDGMVQVNLADADHLEFPTAEKFEGGTAYSEEETAALLEAARKAGEPIRAAVVLGLCYGLRRSEVCVWPNGERVRPDFLTSRTKKLMKEAGLRVIRFHDLRHTAASLLAPRVSPQQLQSFLGHEDISTTYGTYAHLMDQERKATSDAMNAVLEKVGVLF